MGRRRWRWYKTVEEAVSAPWWEREEDRTTEASELGWAECLLVLFLLPLALLWWPLDALEDWWTRPR